MNQCLFCGQPVRDELSLAFLLSFRPYHPKLLCRDCDKRFVPISDHHRCRICGKSGNFTSRVCKDCRRWLRTPTAWFRNRSLYHYNSMMQQYMHRYKFQGDYRLRRIFQRRFGGAVRATQCLVVPVPLNPATYRRRGFNQVRGLLGDIKCVDALKTVNRKKARAQSQKTRRERLKLPQPFQVTPQVTAVRDRDVVVVDDVYTTGATIRHAALLLKRSGAKSVTGMTLAH